MSKLSLVCFLKSCCFFSLELAELLGWPLHLPVNTPQQLCLPHWDSGVMCTRQDVGAGRMMMTWVKVSVLKFTRGVTLDKLHSLFMPSCMFGKHIR